jgi:hypothetical protein
MSKFYLIKREDVGPNGMDEDPIYEIHNAPGRTNSSREERTEGWLGTTNDISRHALGEFDSVLEAVREIPHGYTIEFENGGEPDSDGTTLFTYRRNVCKWDAADWFEGLGSIQRQAESLGITASTTDEELAIIGDREYSDAFAERDDQGAHYEVLGVSKHLIGLRDYMKQETSNEH